MGNTGGATQLLRLVAIPDLLNRSYSTTKPRVMELPRMAHSRETVSSGQRLANEVRVVLQAAETTIYANGVTSSSPWLHGTCYHGSKHTTIINLNGVAPALGRGGTEPRCGSVYGMAYSQGRPHFVRPTF